MKPGTRKLLARLAVLVPTVVMGLFLAHRGVPIGPRTLLVLMFGYMLIKAVSGLMRATSDVIE
jgi:hypothetical protein